jgi:predicted dehydrogenase
MKRVNVATLSFGHFHAYSYTRAVKELPGANLVAVADEDPGRAKEAGQRYNVDYYLDYHDVLRRDDVDAVVVTSENTKHAKMAIDAAEAGKHILCEKPMATTLADADNMMRAAQTAGRTFQMCFVMRYHAASRLIKDVLDKGQIGKIVAITGTNHLKWLEQIQTGFFARPELSGGGSVMDHTVHLSDMMRWYTKSEARRVYTTIGKNIHTEIPVEDNALTMIDFRNGAVGTIDGSWSRSAPWYMWGDMTLEIIGTEGLLLLDAFRQVVYVTQADPPNNRLEWNYWGCDADKEMVRSFVDCILEGKKPTAGAFDGRQGTEITAACYESAKRGAPVNLPLNA